MIDVAGRHDGLEAGLPGHDRHLRTQQAFAFAEHLPHKVDTAKHIVADLLARALPDDVHNRTHGQRQHARQQGHHAQE